MKVLMLNGSPRTKGNTFIALEEMKKVFEAEGVEAEIVQVGNKDVRGSLPVDVVWNLAKSSLDFRRRKNVHLLILSDRAS